MTGRRPDEPVPSDISLAAGPPLADPAPHLWLVPPPLAPPAVEPHAALHELDALLARPTLDDRDIARLAALALLTPGRLRAVVAALAAVDSAAAVDALLTFPQVPGALEAVARALARGLTRALVPGASGEPPVRAPVFLALDFRSSRARPFPDLLRRAQLLAATPGDAFRLDVLRVDARPAYRLSFWPDTLAPRPRAALARASLPDLALLHARLARVRGTRLWLSGFCLDAAGPVSPAAQSHLLRAWLTWSEGHAP